MQLQRFERTEDGQHFPYLVWQPDKPRLTLSSASLGGGFGLREWVLNATVNHRYNRDDPAIHLQHIADEAGLNGTGVGLMTAVWVDSYTFAAEEGVSAWVTTGVDEALWAAAPSPNWHEKAHAKQYENRATTESSGNSLTALNSSNQVGTINMVVEVEASLEPGALVNLASTITEAKVQALFDAGHTGTGTATDAFCVMCSPNTTKVEPYGGIRSLWGARVARIVHAAVTEGLEGLN